MLRGLKNITRSKVSWYIAVGSFLLVVAALLIQISEYSEDQPRLSLKILKFSTYGEFDTSYTVPTYYAPDNEQDSIPRWIIDKEVISAKVISLKDDSIVVYRPWVGITIECNNSGKQQLSIKQFSLAGRYQTKHTNFPFKEDRYYFAGTRTPNNKLGQKRDVLVHPGSREIVHLIVCLNLPFDQIANKVFLKDLQTRKEVRDIFSTLVITALDLNGNVHKSNDLFSIRPEVGARFPNSPYGRIVFGFGPNHPPQMTIPLEVETSDRIRP